MTDARRAQLAARSLLSVAALLVTLIPISQARAATGVPNAAVLTVLKARPSAVRTVGHIPPRWNLLLDGNGLASVVLFMYDGTVTIGGVSRPREWVSVSVMLDSSKLPAGIHSTSKVDTLPSDLYLISWATSSAALASWLHHAGLGAASSYTPALRFALGAGALPSFGFSAGPGYASPFTFTATLTPTFLPTLPDTVDYWRDTPAGTVKIETNDNNESVGTYLGWRFRTAPSTPIARMIGGATQTASCSATTIADPLLGLLSDQVRTGCISREAFSSTTLSRAFIPHR